MVKLTKAIGQSYVVAFNFVVVEYGMVFFSTLGQLTQLANLRCVSRETADYKLVRGERRCHGHDVSQGDATQGGRRVEFAVVDYDMVPTLFPDVRISEARAGY